MGEFWPLQSFWLTGILRGLKLSDFVEDFVDFVMARMCEVCGKRAQKGNSVETRGKAKYLGGVGTKITGITRRQFRPKSAKGTCRPVRMALTKSMKVCTQCIRSGAVRKTVRRKPFELPSK